MKDLFSKITFGFFMAVFVPGVVVVLAISFAYTSYNFAELNSFYLISKKAFSFWEGSLFLGLTFIALSIGSGMAIHGLHWGILGYLENRKSSKHYPGEKELKKGETWHAHRSFWHTIPIWKQLLVGPIKLIMEIWFFIKAPELDYVILDENAPFIKKDKFDVFNFLQEFYLHHAQFYMHVSYALMFAFFSISASICFVGFTTKRGLLLVLVYFISSYFFIIGRIQLASLFNAENSLREDEEKK